MDGHSTDFANSKMLKGSIGKEVVIVGFPKCGTTALTRSFKADEDYDLITLPNGDVEVKWPYICQVPRQVSSQKIRAHKFTAYIFNKKALEFLAQDNPSSIIVLCIRDPKKSLVSWHNMHVDIARTGRRKDHFAYLERDFYANCTIDKYFQHYARSRLRYDRYFERLLKNVPPERVVVISQERLALQLDDITKYLKAVACGQDAVLAPAPTQGVGHTSFAERAGVVLNDKISERLEAVQSRLYAAIRNSGVHSCI